VRWREIPVVPRVALVVLLVSNAVVGVWAQVAPRSFYDSFPGFGRMWVALDGPYNQHLVRDVGGLNLGLAFVIAMALVSASPLLVRAAGGASLIYGLPHLLYHATHLKPFDAGDAVAIVVALSVAVLAAAAALEARFPGDVTSGRTAPPPG
jgi:hypothetical protein